ncbi:MAG: patatin-like phospholipase family protein [Sphaerochaetaceae bacterium]
MAAPFSPRTQSLFQFNVIGQLFTHKYDDLPFKRVLYDVFADSRLADALVPTMVVTYDIGNDRPQLLSSYDTPFVPIRTAARATSAAPTYFAPASVVLDDSTAPHSLVDGGVVANNPVLYAYREAKKLYPDAKMFHILSISTAHSSYKLEIEKSNSGVIGWLDPAKGAPIYRLYASSQMRTSSEIAASLPDLEYVRIHSDLERHIKLDETDAHELNYLIQSAKKIEAAHQTQIESFCQQLQNRPIHPLRPTGTIG